MKLPNLSELLAKNERFFFANSNRTEGHKHGWSKPMLLAYGSEKDVFSFKDLKRNANLNLAGIISYDAKNHLEKLSSNNAVTHTVPDVAFFEAVNWLTDIDAISNLGLPQGDTNKPLPKTEFKSRLSKSEYLKKVQSLKQHIKRGDVYVINFCQEFCTTNIELDPWYLYSKLNAISPMPFSSVFRWGNQVVVSASPERFLKKAGSQIISQPIKGTIGRGASVHEDVAAKETLANSPKDQSENVMIVDLVRNDLSRIAEKNSVEVNELFGVYSLPQVHQMISTVSAKLNSEKSTVDSIQATFPMGSMTGAPKIRAMELIEKYEESKRGWYSGALGYFSENGDFDLSVTIRSLFYNLETKTLSFQVGGAIVDESDPEKEYAECLLKAKAIFKTFGL